MINGGETHDNTSGVAFHDSFDLLSRKSNEGVESPEISPRYSSCGESGFDRYCSANSIMDTPSMCSSIGAFNDCLETEFGDDSSLDNFSLGPSRKLSYMQKDRSGGVGLGVGNERIGVSTENEGVSDNMDRVASQGGGSLEERFIIDEASILRLGVEDRYEDEEGNSSRDEYSHGDDSMYGTDDERQYNSYYPKGFQYGDEAKVQNANPLVINSSIAFGSDDWGDFEQENGTTFLSPLNLGKFQEQKKLDVGSEEKILRSTSIDSSPMVSSFGQREGKTDQIDLPTACGEVEDAHNMNGNFDQLREARDKLSRASFEVQNDANDILASCNQVKNTTDRVGQENGALSDFIKELKDQQVEDPLGIGLDDMASIMDMDNRCVDAKEVVATHGGSGFNYQQSCANDATNQVQLSSTETSKELSSELAGNNDHKPPPALENASWSQLKNSVSGAYKFEVQPAPVKTQNFELNDIYDEVVHDMEEILLDSGKSPGTRFSQGDRIFQSQLSQPIRGGISAASTSGTDEEYQQNLQPLRIDMVEVVGAKQKKGNVSLSERLVGVKKYTVYIIRVWSGNDRWDIERRYRDFLTLYRRLKSLYDDQGWILPAPWSSVETESRKIFGVVSPNVIAERSVLIQQCLSSVIHSRSLSSPLSALSRFLSVQDPFPSSPVSDRFVSFSSFNRGADTESISTLGKTISLIVEIQPPKSMKQLLEAQHYSCAGCYKHFDNGTLMRDFVQAFGWGKPRLCEYTSQLFCSSCHTNETALLPARVLHHWDFSRHPVSQMAKSYLDSIHDQPMLCVSAVNPFLFSKVPALQQVMSIRKKIGTMLPFVRCPFRRSINKGLGSRRYLLESNDFFALKDLVDLSKGAFAALPVIVETVSRKILEHIMEQCLICCDVGVACSGRQACSDPSSLIFPFQQEGEVERCSSCSSVFHKPCFKKLVHCPCGMQLRDNINDSINGETSGALNLSKMRSISGLSSSFLSGLFSKPKSEKNDSKDSDTIILMGALPSNAL